MLNFFLGFLVVVAIIVLLIGYLVLFVPILGIDAEKRIPVMTIVSLIVVYLESLAFSYFFEASTVRVIVAILIGGLLLAQVASFFSTQKSNIIADILTYIAFIFGSVYIIYPRTFIKLADIAKSWIKNQEVFATDLWDVISLIISVVSIVVVVVVLINMRKRVNTLDYQIYNTQKRMKMNDNIQSFSEPYQNYLRDDIKEMIEQMRHEIVEEVRISNFDSGLGPIYTPVDELSKLTRELKGLKKAIKRDIRKQDEFSVGDFVSDMKHSLMTPLSQILSNCELIEDELPSAKAKHELERIEKNVKVCQSIINSYKEVIAVSRTKTFIGLKDAFSACLESAERENGKTIRGLEYGDGFIDNLDGYSNNLLIGLMAPLINNAVAASPDDSIIEIDIDENEDFYRLSITNYCQDEPPSLLSLNTIGYSSKENHQGVGLSTVRNMIRLMKSAELMFEINENKVSVIINLAKRT